MGTDLTYEDNRSAGFVLTWLRARTVWLRCVVAFVILVGSAVASLFLPQINDYIRPVWLPAGIAVAVVYLLGGSVWPAIFAYALFTEFILFPRDWNGPDSIVLPAFLLAAIKSAAPVITVAVWRRLSAGLPPFARLQDYMVFIPGVVCGTAGLVAVAGTLLAWGAGRLDGGQLISNVMSWFVGDAVAILFVVPLFVHWLYTPQPSTRQIGTVELVLIGTMIVVDTAFFAGHIPGFEFLAGRPPLLFPIILWGVIRLSPRWNSAFAFFVFCSLSVGVALLPPEAGATPFALPISDDVRFNDVMGLQLIIGSIFMAVFLISTLMSEREAQAMSLHALNLDLERRVDERTRDLQESEKRIRSITSASQDAIIMIDPDSRIVFWNPAATRLFGYDEDSVMGQPVHDVLPPPEIRHWAKSGFEKFRHTGTGPAIGNTMDLVGLTKDGRRLPVEMSVATLPREEGHGAVAVLRDITQRKETERLLKAEKRRADRLLRNILPEKVIDRVGQDEAVVADHFTDVSILFCDLVGYTRMCSGLSAERTVTVLNTIFTAFDDLVRDHKVEKIKTMGDGYMAAAGVPEPVEDHADRLIRLALDMLETTDRLRDEFGLPLHLRAGIHSGEVVAGVIGKDKFIFDVWGDTVNVASRMERATPAGAIRVSDHTATLICSEIIRTGPFEIDVKGKGRMQSFLIDRTGCSMIAS